MVHKKVVKNKFESGIALITLGIAITATTVVAISLASIFNWFFGDDNETEETKNIKEQIRQEIEELNLPEDRDIYDFEITPILEKYGTINYNWRNKIKSLTLSDGTEIDIDELYDGKIEKSTVEEQYEGGVYNQSAKIETPKLGENMVGVYWSDGTKNSDGTYRASATSTEVEVTSDSNDFSWMDWYDYVDSNMANIKNIDTKLSRWANAKSTIDGSYFVWIPRFEYKITNEHSSSTGTITINFISTSQTQPTSADFKIHPAFTNGNGNYDNGEWDAEISGFWVAKYEMSMEISEDEEDWKSIEPEYIDSSIKGNVLTSSDSDTYKRAVSKPNCYAWNYISIGKAYENASLYDEENQSHLIKNSEWGAVAYLTHSQYGRNGNSIGTNTYYYNLNGFSKLTGFGKENVIMTDRVTNDNRYNGVYGRNASTTGNIYGVYDMSGGNWEYTAAYFTSNEIVQKYGNELYTETSGGTSNKYITIYPGKESEDSNTNDSENSDTEENQDTELQEEKPKVSISTYYDSWSEIYGDAIYETSSGCGYYTAWFMQNIDTDSNADEPFFIRGGSYYDESSAGIFSVADSNGVEYYKDNSYRVVLIAP